MTKRIPLTHGQLALVDDKWFDYLNQWNWQARWNKPTKSYYASRTNGTKPNRGTITMHRVIMRTPNDLEVDHVNHDTLDNREYNLRNVTHAQNALNRNMRSDNKIGHKCISQHSTGFQVQVKSQGTMRFRKWFPTLDLAIKARDEAVKKYHGDFSYLPDEVG